MSQEIMDTAVFGLMLGVTVLAAFKMRGGDVRTRYCALSGFALLSAVAGMRVVDHLAVATLGPENSGIVAAADVSLTVLGLFLILRGVSAWKKQTANVSVIEIGSEVSAAGTLNAESNAETGRAVSFRKLHAISCDIALRIEALSRVESKRTRTRVSALEALFEACGENLSGALEYDALTVELAPLNGATAHAITRDAVNGVLKAHFYPVRQSLARACGMDGDCPRLIRKTSDNSDSTCWSRLDVMNVSETLLGTIRCEQGYSLTIAAGYRRSDSVGAEAQFVFGGFLKLVRPLAILALIQAGRAERSEGRLEIQETGWRTAPGVPLTGIASRVEIGHGAFAPSVSGAPAGSDKI
ncbi:MAG: hypothetical protein IH914_03990 [candidate division Zixibacteria bacterium]|nr:hypothetical protein [candidate division Zixibacteria bacterium]